MSISSSFIDRPIATSLLAIAIVLAGILGYRALPVSALPEVDFPAIQVTTQLPGASPQTMASLVTTPLERQLAQITGLTDITSISGEGVSEITLQFELGRNIDAAGQDVQAAINAAGATLPRNLPYPPTYAKVNPADTPILTLALTSETVPLTEVSDVADTLLAQKLSQVLGVGRVAVEGGMRPAIRIEVDPVRMASYGIGLEDVRAALARANVDAPKGAFDGARQSYTIAANDQLTTADGYKSLVIIYRNGAPVRLTDIGMVSEGLENAKVAGWYDSRPAVIVDIQRQPGANIVETVDRVRAQLPNLERSIPAGVDVSIVSDRTDTIRASVRDVQSTLVVSVALVVMVIFLFLRTVRATIIPAAALPLSLIGTFGIMALCGFAVDNLSLMALTIATGFVVDDAIVMIENVARFIEGGETPLQAAYKGAKQIGFTVISLTVSMVAVFVPLLFMTGLVGRLFREFALTLTIAVVVSAVVSLTLTPMMCGRLLQPASQQKPGWLARHAERAFEALLHGYERSLAWVMQRQMLTLSVMAFTLFATLGLYREVPKGLLPLQDTGLIAGITDAGEGISFAAMSRLQTQVADILRRDPSVAGVASFVGAGTINTTANSGHLTIVLKPRADRSDTAQEIITRLQQAVAPVAGIAVHLQPVQDVQIGTRPSRTQFQYTLMDAKGAELAEWAPRLLAKLHALPALRDVTTDQQNNGLRVELQVDRDQTARLGIAMQTIDDTLYDAFGQRQISTIYGQSNQYRVILEVLRDNRIDPSSLTRLYVPSQQGKPIPLAAFTTPVRTTTPLVITHQAQFSSVTLSFNLAEGASLGAAIEQIAKAERELGMPATIVGGYAGDAAEFLPSLESEPWLVLAAVVVIYIVLGVLYESTIHPITILSTLPSAGVGALLALMAFGIDLSLVAVIGIVLLMGIVKKNGIMMIDFALEAQRREGRPPKDAIVQACLLRFRPIMMTTMAALLGALPLALERGTGSELRFPLGITIIGGLLLSQVLTLYTTPVIYLAMERLRTSLRRPGSGEHRGEIGEATSPAPQVAE